MEKQETMGAVKAGGGNWVLVRIERKGKSSEQWAANERGCSSPAAAHLFEYGQHSSFAERFPRLTFFAIACGLLAFALIAEIDCLSGSGYYWR